MHKGGFPRCGSVEADVRLDTVPFPSNDKWGGDAKNLGRGQIKSILKMNFFKKAKTEQEAEQGGPGTPRYDLDALSVKWEDEDNIQALCRDLREGL